MKQIRGRKIWTEAFGQCEMAVDDVQVLYDFFKEGEIDEMARLAKGYKVADPSGYDLDRLKDEFGGKYYRSLRLIKNSYGEDDIRIGLGFLGQIGMFKELPRRKDMTDDDYGRVVNKTFFLDK